MNKKIIFPVILICVIVCRIDAASNNILSLLLNSGTQVVFPLSEEPTIIVTDSVVTIQTQEYAFNDLRKYTIGTPPKTGLVNVEDAKNISIQDGWLYVVTDVTDFPIQLFTIVGQEMPCTSHPTNKGLAIDIQSLPVGAYLLNIGSETIKFQKR